MQATDTHWLQIKQDWLPIESILNDLVPYVPNAKEKIDCLAGQLDGQTVRDLHFLRMQRNRSLHEGQAIVNLARWASAASDARAKLEVLQARQHTAAREEALRLSARVKQAASTGQAGSGAPPVADPDFSQFLASVLLKLVVWCAGSWYLHTGVMFVLSSVATYSAAWWVLHAVGVMCWPGIGMTYLLYGIGLALGWLGEAVFSGIVWLIKYVIANPF